MVTVKEFMKGRNNCAKGCAVVHPRLYFTAIDCKPGPIKDNDSIDEGGCYARMRELFKPSELVGPRTLLKKAESVMAKRAAGLPEGGAGMAKVAHGSSAMSVNQKTVFSFDCSTVCPKLARGEDCSYCYRMPGLMKGGRVKSIDAKAHYNNDVMKWSQEKIDLLNSMGGLRVFSFGDYADTSHCNEMLDRLIKQSKERKLRLKAITKRPDFVEKYSKDIAATGGIINVSVDTLGYGMPWTQAKRFVENKDGKTPGVVARSTAFDKEEVKFWGTQVKNEKNPDGWLTIITPYHGPEEDSRTKERVILKRLQVRKEFDPKRHAEIEANIAERRAQGEIIKDKIKPHNFGQTPIIERIMEFKEIGIDPMNVCCSYDNCMACPAACGSERGRAKRIPGLMHDILAKPDIEYPMALFADLIGNYTLIKKKPGDVWKELYARQNDPHAAAEYAQSLIAKGIVQLRKNRDECEGDKAFIEQIMDVTFDEEKLKALRRNLGTAKGCITKNTNRLDPFLEVEAMLPEALNINADDAGGEQ